MTTTKTIADQLTATGYSLTFACKDAGNRDTSSKWTCTLHRNGAEMTVEYTKGPAHRRWKRGYHAGVDSQLVAEMGGRGNRVARTYRLSVMAAESIDKGSEPEPPTIDEVLHSLTLDASGVRHGQTFDDWCDEYGSDSIKAHKMFDACRDELFDLIRLGADLDALDELFIDY